MLKKRTPPASRPRRTAAPDRSDLRLTQPLPEPERLVGLGFRYWMRGRQSGEIALWERTWCLYSGMFGLCGARMAVGTLSNWVAALHKSSQRTIEVFPADCRGFCKDECIAVSMIAACQHNTCPAMRACAFALIESSMVDRVVQEAQTFADTLSSLEQRLSAGSIVTAPVSNVSAGARLH
jgi:hypothetical protein